VKFEIFTWGSCQRGYLRVLHPIEVDVADLTSRRGEGVVEIPGVAVLRFENRDSSRNMHREVEFIDVQQPLVVRYYGARSCSKSFDDVYLVKKVDGQVVVERLEQKEEVAVVENGKYRVTTKRTYVEVDGKRVYVAESEIRREVCTDRLVVKVKASGTRVYVLGDTYHVKDRLKEMKYRWDPNVKAWFKDLDVNKNVNKVVEELESIGVQVVAG
jgi:hypothetical protein